MQKIISAIIVILVFALGFIVSPSILQAEISPIGQYDTCEGTCGCQPKTQAPVVTENAVINECGQSSGASITGNTVTAFAWNESATLSEDGKTLAWQDGSNWIRTLTPPKPGSSCSDMPPNECAVCCANEHKIRQAKCRGNASCTLDSVRQLLACHTTCTFQ